MRNKDYIIETNYNHRIRFTKNAFDLKNTLLEDLIKTENSCKVLVFIDQGVSEVFPELKEQVSDYLAAMSDVTLCGVIEQTGGEACKRDANTLQKAWDSIEEAGIDRHSYIFCIGGGAYLDVIGMAAATAHRGIRFVRFPTTTLSQDDSGVGVKNGINAYGKKNFLGSFSVPYAVVNDFAFLHSQPEKERRDGLIEAIKVALVKDADFFYWIEKHSHQLSQLDHAILEEAVERSAHLHASHIAYGGDPFETGNNRPLDYGHWSAHKIEQLTDFALSHAEAVSIGVAIDTVYAWKLGSLDEVSTERILQVIKTLQLPLWHPILEHLSENRQRSIYEGLEEFREHLGGELTILMLSEIGIGENVHQMDTVLLDQSIDYLKNQCSISSLQSIS